MLLRILNLVKAGLGGFALIGVVAERGAQHQGEVGQIHGGGRADLERRRGQGRGARGRGRNPGLGFWIGGPGRWGGRRGRSGEWGESESRLLLHLWRRGDFGGCVRARRAVRARGRERRGGSARVAI